MLLFWKTFAVLLLGCGALSEVDHQWRNLSEIRYHFTPCGAMGRSGPTHADCIKFYTSISSPILRDGALTDTYGATYSGSQSFRPPRATKWNVTIAGASGGRGLCNLEQGLGLVQYLTEIDLDVHRDVLILAGQRGLGPCDTDPMNDDLGHSLCTSPPPTNISETLICDRIYYGWSLTAPNYANITGGGGGGGASMVSSTEYNTSSLFEEIIGISGGGGGTSSVFSFFHLISTWGDYTNFINAKLAENEDDAMNSGSRGYRVGELNPIAGAGGGYSERLHSIFPPLRQSDGRALNNTMNFAEGGFHCLSEILEVADVYSVAVGGFGGGGGGCDEGGGGGGFTGGSVFGNSDVIPGGGGFSFFPFLQPENNVSFNLGDGYVDIVAADCGCSYQCVVYEEEDQFQCLCPNHTLMAPDLSDCYLAKSISVSQSENEINNNMQNVRMTTTAGASTGNLNLEAVNFGNATTTYFLYGARVNFTRSRVATTDKSGGLCTLLFVGESDKLVLISDTISGPGRVSRIGSITISRNGLMSVSNFSSFLEEPILVTGGIIASSGPLCAVEEAVFNVSIRQTDYKEVNFTSILSDLYNVSSESNRFIRQLLNLPLDEEEEENGDGDQRQTSLSEGETALIVIALLLLVCGVSLVLIVALVLYGRRRRNRQIVGQFTHDTGGPALDYLRYTNRRLSEDLMSNGGYETLNFKENDGVVELFVGGGGGGGGGGGTPFESKYGVTATEFDFAGFNRSRINTGLRDWEYPRSKLIFMRDLGEGQFGKVMLMRASSIAGYSGDVPVAVKTLASRDPAIIQKFTDETDLMKKFAHPNIVSLLGVCNMSIKEDSAPLMILEYMPYGDLKDFLESNRPTEENPVSLITERHFYSFAIDVAKAMEFLSSQKYVHRDIAARNCLVGANLLIKIADFGLARGVYDKEYYRIAGRAYLPVRWMPPECLLYGLFTTFSDVWAYGVLLWEITSYGSTPLSDYNSQEVVAMAQEGSLRHPRPATCPEDIYKVMRLCHIINSEDRPTFSYLLSLLEETATASTTIASESLP